MYTMQALTRIENAGRAVLLLTGGTLWMLAPPIVAGAQDATTTNGAQTNSSSNLSSTADPALVAQIRELQAKVAKLEAALQKKYGGRMRSGRKERPKQSATNQAGNSKRSMGTDSPSDQETAETGMRGKAMRGKAMRGKAMRGKAMGGKGRMRGKKGVMAGKGMSGMAMMGQVKGMGAMEVPSALPGFAGASHIYHIGATSFYLDHPQHITLTQQQRTRLSQIKEKTLLAQATFDRWISEAEQELWVLTGSDAPDVVQVEAKLREIEKLRGDKRLAFIRAVGDAANFLTGDQRRALVGSGNVEAETPERQGS